MLTRAAKDIFGKVNRRMMSNVHSKYKIFRAVA
jgi:hypothetical protein